MEHYEKQLQKIEWEKSVYLYYKDVTKSEIDL